MCISTKENTNQKRQAKTNTQNVTIVFTYFIQIGFLICTETVSDVMQLGLDTELEKMNFFSCVSFCFISVFANLFLLNWQRTTLKLHFQGMIYIGIKICGIRNL